MVEMHRALERLRVAAQGRNNIENVGRMLTEVSSGGKHLVYVRVEDLAALLEAHDRIDCALRGQHDSRTR